MLSIDLKLSPFPALLLAAAGAAASAAVGLGSRACRRTKTTVWGSDPSGDTSLQPRSFRSILPLQMEYRREQGRLGSFLPCAPCPQAADPTRETGSSLQSWIWWSLHPCFTPGLQRAATVYSSSQPASAPTTSPQIQPSQPWLMGTAPALLHVPGGDSDLGRRHFLQAEPEVPRLERVSVSPAHTTTASIPLVSLQAAVTSLPGGCLGVSHEEAVCTQVSVRLGLLLHSCPASPCSHCLHHLKISSSSHQSQNTARSLFGAVLRDPH